MADGFADKEKEWKSSLGQTIGNACTAIVEADSLAKDMAIKRTIQLLERDNVEFSASTTLIGMDTKLQTGISVPVIGIVNKDPIVVKQATVHMSLNVHEQASNNTDTKVNSETTVGANFGFFGQGGSINQTVKAGVENKRKRSSDYTSGMDVDIVMEQAPPPEGLMIIVDGLMETVKVGQLINHELINRQAQKLQEQVGNIDELPESNENSGE